MNRTILAIDVITLADQHAGFARAEYAGTRQFAASSLFDQIKYMMKREDVARGIAVREKDVNFQADLMGLNQALVSGSDEDVKRALRMCYYTALYMLRQANQKMEAA